MKINIFEGARRLTKLIAVIWVLGMSFYVFTHESYIPAYFRVDSPDSVPIRMSEQERCNESDAEEYLSQYTSKGSKISITLCFKSIVFDNGRKLIPLSEMSYIEWDKRTNGGQKPLTAEDKKLVWGYEKHSTEVSKHTEKVAASFKFSKADEEWADSVAWSERWRNTKFGASVTIGGLAFLWIFSWCVGWIVRGFAGIPTGQDFKS
jgi:hypothetical protein